MEELSIDIKGRGEVKGMFLKQIAKSEKAYVYERTDSEGNNDGYETFRRKINKKVWVWELPRQQKVLVFGRGA